MKSKKQSIREELDVIVTGLKGRDIFDKSICENVFNQIEKDGGEVMLFKPFKDEPDISLLINKFLDEKFNIYFADYKEIAFVVKKSGGKMTNFTFLDIVVLPGRGFDKYGNRIGRGGGWYDRVLNMLRPDCKKIGVCYEVQILDSIPVEKYDRPVDMVITEKSVYNTVQF